MKLNRKKLNEVGRRKGRKKKGKRRQSDEDKKKRRKMEQKLKKKEEHTTKINTKVNKKCRGSAPVTTSSASASASTVTPSDSMASTSSGTCSTGRIRILSMKAVDTYELSSRSSNEEDDAGFLCGKMEPEIVLKQVDWIACHSCERWYREHCISQNVDEQFICHLCEG